MKNQEILYKRFGQFLPAGTVLFEEGQGCDAMYIILKGRIRLFKKAGGQEIDVDFLGEGDFFGEMACLIGQPRSIDAVVMEDSEVLVVGPEVLEQLFRESSGLSLKILGKLAGRLRTAYGIIERLAAEIERITAKEQG